jgi:hypothetical protein
MNGIDGTHASPAYRDGFLSALDRNDGVTLARLAQEMTSCGNPLPSVICVQLGIPVGSTYGFAARRIVAQGAEGWIAPRQVVAPATPSNGPDVVPG